MQIRLVVTVCLCALVLSCPLGFGSVPSSITVQGKLTDSAGIPMAAGPKNFTFKIFGAPVGGGQVWPDIGGEAQTITSSTDGTWVGLVGAVVPILHDALADTSRWLEITVDGTTLPRVRLTTGPYAFRVGTVDGATGGTITSKVSIGPGHTNSGVDAFVAGSGNSVSGPAATVSGGTGNAVSGYTGTIGGGQHNRVGANYGTVGGGYADTAGNIGSTVAGGSENAAMGDYATIGGGQNNKATQLETTIGGGRDNLASGSASTIGGGRENQATATEATVAGGQLNLALSSDASIGGGQGNTASAFAATIAGGYQNIASGTAASIAGGQSNQALATGSAIGGGDGNISRGLYSVITGGGGSLAADSNAARGDWTFIGGGHHNIAEGDSSIVVSGTRNTANGNGAVVVGGSDNHARGNYSFVGGGGGMNADSNSAIGQFSVAVGGNHAVALGDFSLVGGGYVNHADGDYSSVVGGYINSTRSTGDYKFIGGGRRNDIDAGFSSIVGGDSNTVSGGVSFIGGGRRNSVGGGFSAVLGGQRNYAGGAEAVCIGGREDTANAGFSVTLGGFRNRTGSSAKYSMAAGKRAKADHAGSFVWADSTDADFASSGINQFLVRAAGGVGIGTASPEGPFHVQKGSAGSVTANSNSIAVFETSSTNGWLSILGTDNAERGLLFTEPSAAVAGAIVFDQGGGGNDIGFRTGGNVTNMTLDASGNLTVVGCVDGNNTACASDRRLKRNISTVNDALSLIEDLRGVRYEWRADEFPERHFESGTQYGVIAQEVREVVPEVIREREDGYLSVEYNGLIPILIEAIKTQQSLIDEQNERIINLEKKLEQ